MPSKTETSLPSQPLQALSVGAIVTITQESAQAYVAPINSTQFAIAMGNPPPKFLKSTFVITMYQFNGSNQAKISLQPLGMEGLYWVAGQSVEGLTNPILLAPEPGHFLLTDVGDGHITIRNTRVPPGPYLHGYGKGVRVLSYGFDKPLIQGRFSIQLVG